jgi:hypothetical protein
VAELLITKTRLSKEKHTKLFNMNFMCHRDFIRKWRLKEVVNPRDYYLRWKKKEEQRRNYRTRKYELCHKLGPTARLIHLDSSLCPCVFRDEDNTFLWVQGGYVPLFLKWFHLITLNMLCCCILEKNGLNHCKGKGESWSGIFQFPWCEYSYWLT